MPNSPAPQQGASDPINRLTFLCVYLFYADLFSLKSTSYALETTRGMPPQMCQIVRTKCS